MVTPASAWRESREQGVEIFLPSGKSALLRPVDVDFFVRIGRIPSLLAPIIAKLIDGEAFVPDKMPEGANEASKEWVDFLNQLVTAAFVQPQVVDVPIGDEREVRTPQGENEISIDDVEYRDKVYVYGLFTRPARLLKSFHQKQVERLSALATPAGNGTARVGDIGNSELG